MGFPCFYSNNRKNKTEKTNRIANAKDLNDNEYPQNPVLKINPIKKSENFQLFDSVNQNEESFNDNSIIIYNKDNNLELTDFFKNNNSIEKYTKNKLMEKFNNILNEIEHKNNIYENNNLNIDKISSINEKISNNFGIYKGIETNFEETKNILNLCQNLSEEDEQMINNLTFLEYNKNEIEYKLIFKEIISENEEELIKTILDSN